MLTTVEAPPSRSRAREAVGEAVDKAPGKAIVAEGRPGAAAFSEQTAVLDCAGEALHAVVTIPAAVCQATGVVIVVGGPQYRAGSHRQFVLLARALAAAGFAVLRFDCRGMGDSAGERRSFEGFDDDIAAAIGGLSSAVPAVRRVVLWGLCDGAAAALLYCEARPDARVSGLCLVNPWVRSETSLARAHVRHYYARRVLEPAFWSKLLRGGVAAGAVVGFACSVRAMLNGRSSAAVASRAFQDRMAAAWRRFSGDVLLVLSGRDLTALEFLEHARVDRAWHGVIDGARTVRHDLAEADHTFSHAAQRVAVEDTVVGWMKRWEGRADA